MKLLTGSVIWSLAFGAIACGGGGIVGGEEPPPADPKGVKIVDEQVKKDLERVKEAKILFAHHSVGENLLDGVKDLSAEAGVQVTIAEQRPGANGDPKKKIDDFVDRVLKEPKEGGAELAVFKLCYADFSPQTNPDQLVGWYTEAVAKIRAARPDLMLMHVTAPATVFRNDWKTKMKRMIGKEVWEDASAMRRLAYNEKLKAALKGEMIFDLAAVESQRPSGQIEMFELNGQKYPALYSGYTMDGGHLNELGRKFGARAFLRAMAEALDKRPKTAAVETEQPQQRVD